MNSQTLLIGGLIIAAGIISLEVGLSVAILEVTAGVIAKNLFGVASLDWIDLLANFGLLGLMFYAGFETDVPLLKKNWKKSLSLGAISYFLPFVVIYLVSRLALGLSNPVSLLMGVGLSATSLAIVYTILKEKGALQKPSSQIMLSGAMIVDILSMISLTVLFEGITLTSIIVLVLVFFSIFILPKLGKLIFSRYHGDVIEFKTRFILIILLGLFVISERIHVHVAVLAFIAGFVFSELIEEHRELEEKLKALIFGFMAPMFFFKAGLSIDLFSLDLSSLQLIVLLGFVVLAAKYFSSFFTAKIFFKGNKPQFAGWLFSFNLTFGIIVASFGLREGMIGQTMYTVILTILLGTAIFSSVMIKLIPHEI